MSDTRKRLLVQQPGKGGRWQALEVMDGQGGPSYELTDLETPQATQYQQEGGFEIVPGERFNEELRAAHEAMEAQRAAAARPEEMPQPPGAAAVAMGRASRGETAPMTFPDGLGEAYTPPMDEGAMARQQAAPGATGAPPSALAVALRNKAGLAAPGPRVDVSDVAYDKDYGMPVRPVRKMTDQEFARQVKRPAPRPEAVDPRLLVQALRGR